MAISASKYVNVTGSRGAVASSEEFPDPTPTPPPPPGGGLILLDGALSALNPPTISLDEKTATYTNIPALGLGGVASESPLGGLPGDKKVFAVLINVLDPDLQVNIALVDPSVTIDDIQNPASYANKVNLFSFSATFGLGTQVEGDTPPGFSMFFPLPVFPGNNQVFFFWQNGTAWEWQADNLKPPQPLQNGFGNFNPAHTKLLTWVENVNVGAPQSGEYEIISEASEMEALGFTTYRFPAGSQDWAGNVIDLTLGSKQPFSTAIDTNSGTLLVGRTSNQSKTLDLAPFNVGSGSSPLSLATVLYPADIPGGRFAVEYVVDAFNLSVNAGQLVSGIGAIFAGSAVQMSYLTTGSILCVDTEANIGGAGGITLSVGDRFALEIDITGNSWKAYYKPVAGPQVTLAAFTMVAPNFFNEMFQQYAMLYSGSEIGSDTVTISMMQDGGDYQLAYTNPTTNTLNEVV